MHAPHPQPTPVVRVWDLPTRLYHWSQAALVAAGLITGFLAPAWWLGIHVWVGYGLVALIVFRLVWGFCGSHFSRFSSFVYAPAAILAHVRKLIRGEPAGSIGHTPLGSLMVFALIAVIALIGITGMLALGGMENQGPLAAFVGFSTGATARRLHSLLSAIVMVLIGLHLLGVFVESWLSRENLVAAMLTGRKPVAAIAGLVGLQPARRGTAAIVIVVALAVIVLAAREISQLPPSGFVTLPVLKAYQSECGACHEAYHPSLLPRASWAKIMAHLDNHFGEDASLDPATTQAIAGWLNTYPSEAWDTEAANRLRSVDPADPTRITAAPMWKRIHHRIDPSVFKLKAVHDSSNCAACHRDAVSGRFDDQMIAIPAH